MRIVITNPDGIGDAVLRLPLFEELQRAGHDLLLICRGHALPLFARLAGNPTIIPLVENPYEFTRSGRVDFSPVMLESVREFSPDLLMFGAYQWTILEEQLAHMLPSVHILCMNGYRFEHEKNQGVPLRDGTAVQVVEVGEYWHETLKNRALCEAILGHEVSLSDPFITVTPTDIECGRSCLSQVFGTDSPPKQFWFGCMGTTGDYYGDLKDWGSENWATMLRHLVLEKRQAVLLVGSAAERESLERVRTQSGLLENIRVVTGDVSTPEDLSQLLGLTWLSQAYIGRDTGPMHIAAAVKKPVVAVFGAGMWPRFTPMATPSFAMAVDLPCAPCRWNCHQPESWCVKRVPVASVMEAVDTIASGSAALREARLIAPSPELREAAGQYRITSRPVHENTTAAEGKTLSEAASHLESGPSTVISELPELLLNEIRNLRTELGELRKQMTGQCAEQSGG